MKCPHCHKVIEAAALLGAKGGAAGTGASKARTPEQMRAAALKRWAKVRKKTKAKPRQ